MLKILVFERRKFVYDDCKENGDHLIKGGVFRPKMDSLDLRKNSNYDQNLNTFIKGRDNCPDNI